MRQLYTAKTFQIAALDGISAKQIEEHLKLYAGYVKNTNALIEKTEEMKKDSAKYAIELSELTRRFAFEFDGMRLHEVYFDQFDQSVTGKGEALKSAITAQYGSFEAWVNEAKAVGKMRGIGWVLLVQDELNGNLHTIWISDHEYGHLAGLKILFAMDVWEHAYMVDYGPTQRPDYIEAFFKNLNWNVVEARYQA